MEEEEDEEEEEKQEYELIINSLSSSSTFVWENVFYSPKMLSYSFNQIECILLSDTFMAKDYSWFAFKMFPKINTNSAIRCNLID